MTQQTQHVDAINRPLTTGELAHECGVDRWHILAAIRRGFLTEPGRIGVYRVWTIGDVARVVDAMTRAGYLRPGGKGSGPRPRATTRPTPTTLAPGGAGAGVDVRA